MLWYLLYSSKPLLMIGLIKPMDLICKKISLLSHSKLSQPVNYFSFMVPSRSPNDERLHVPPQRKTHTRWPDDRCLICTEDTFGGSCMILVIRLAGPNLVNLEPVFVSKKLEEKISNLRKCQGKFDCLVFEMLYIKKFKPNLNVQTDSIREKLFV